MGTDKKWLSFWPPYWEEPSSLKGNGAQGWRGWMTGGAAGAGGAGVGGAGGTGGTGGPGRTGRTGGAGGWRGWGVGAEGVGMAPSRGGVSIYRESL